MMIFKGINELDNKVDKKFFIEQIEVFIRLVEVFCEKNNVCNDETSSLNEEVIEELIDMGVITHYSEIPNLKKFLKSKFNQLIKSVNFVVKNKFIIKDTIWRLYNSERKKVQIRDKNKNLSVVDFFCGAGGLSLGFVHEGFNIKLANDIEDVCIQTYKYNHPELPSQFVIQDDIKILIDNIHKYIKQPIDVVVGGPPCQGFSLANQQRIIDDPRNELYKYFIEMIKIIAPKFVVMENVKGMLKVADQVIEDFAKVIIKKDDNELSYEVSYQILNSKDFSVAQSRERLIYIAVRTDISSKYNISPEDLFKKINEKNQENTVYTLNDALKDIKPLEAPRIKNMTNVDSEISGKKIDVNVFDSTNNDYLNLINNNRKIDYVFNHKARYCNDINYEIYKRLNQGEDSTNDKIKDIMPYSHRNHVFKDKYYKLIGNKPCRTITAHLRMDCHSHIHPYQVRALTPREAARVQSFPDDYLFWGAYLKTYMQIGNAVPPLMAQGIAKVLKEYLEE